MDAREAAMLTLNACQRQGGWSDGVLKKQLAAADLDSRDAALATQLCFGVLQNQLLLDFYLSKFSNIPLKRMEGKVVQILRLGAYQMLFLDKIPHSAAVNSAVAITKANCKNPRAAGMVNGILRSLERSLNDLPVIPQGDQAAYLSTLYSHPEWLVKEFILTLGAEEAAQLLAADNSQPPTCVMVNTTRTTGEELTLRLKEAGVEVRPHSWLEDCLLLSRTGDLERLTAFQEGLFYVQDPASRSAIMAADPKPGMRVLDCCAAPGGKSFAAAIAMENRGEVVSCDLHPHKKKLIQAGADRLGLDIVAPMTADGKVFRSQWENAFDLVLVDAPCSGLGVIRKKPDIRYKDPKPLAELPAVQSAILANAARYVRPGGTLLYSTCTLLRRENEAVVRDFLEGHPTYKAEAFTLPGPVGEVEDGMVTLWPHRHGTDGFFICKLRKGEDTL
ncbi:16S rRNA (cytosine(967)-C(5))-methyltransferase RsmB [Pseudoflavonifractor phocaeensis]|uniref:16S rRNA (cytosine(967)-C(5))-methyltransferase RsmB n=1 Tax=Pseudoflavonifractor phocaeensis TaxID=1870988 RepID=UPI001F49019A|nr:16S rRNA (cytosine(967)-C(5))-methyltransferase RsmB [Pseudoflavonifractor phocaeensis]MCF2661023.1 16S rRNA (cytosine(967)-C(5))-methyltransferase RsmB [Pseudoflavonifractor phocaeensis]